jgi:hypothetical protein
MIFLHWEAGINFISFFNDFTNKEKTTAQFIFISFSHSTTGILALHHITIPIKKLFCGEEEKIEMKKKKIIQ